LFISYFARKTRETLTAGEERLARTKVPHTPWMGNLDRVEEQAKHRQGITHAGVTAVCPLSFRSLSIKGLPVIAAVLVCAMAILHKSL